MRSGRLVATATEPDRTQAGHHRLPRVTILSPERRSFARSRRTVETLTSRAVAKSCTLGSAPCLLASLRSRLSCMCRRSTRSGFSKSEGSDTVQPTVTQSSSVNVRPSGTPTRGRVICSDRGNVRSRALMIPLAWGACVASSRSSCSNESRTWSSRSQLRASASSASASSPAAFAAR